VTIVAAFMVPLRRRLRRNRTVCFRVFYFFKFDILHRTGAAKSSLELFQL